MASGSSRSRNWSPRSPKGMSTRSSSARRLCVSISCVWLAAVAAPVQAEPAMWVVRDDDSTIYLVGTVHVLRPDMVWNSDKITKALGESTELWLELVDADNQEITTSLIQKHGFDAT